MVGGAPADAEVLPDAGTPPSNAAGWVHPYRGDLQIDGITSDARSDIYAAGYFVGHAVFDPSHAFDSVADGAGNPTKDIFVAKHVRSSGELAWVRHFGGSGAEGNVYDLVAGSDGLVLASGAFSGAVDFDGKRLTATVEAGSGAGSSGTYGNMFLAALDDAGAVRWALQATGDVLSGGNEVTSVPSGGFAQVGMFGGKAEPGGTFTLGGHDLAFDGGRFDTYVSRLSGTGDVLWVAPIGGAGSQRGKGIATDADGNVLVVGDAWDGETRFGPGQSFTSDDQDFWVAKYGPSGNLLWFRSYGSSGPDEVKGVGVDAAGNVIVAAAFQGPSIDLAGTSVAAVAGARNTGVVFSLSSDGTRALWTNTITSVIVCCEIEVDRQGHAFVSTGALGPSVLFGRGGDFPLGGSHGALLAELGAEGDRVAAWTAHADASELGELTLLADGGVGIAGSFEGTEMTLGTFTVPGGPLRTQFVLALPR